MALNESAHRAFGVGAPARVSPLYNPKVRSVVFQAALVIALILIVAWFVDNTLENLRRTRITSGFDFLWRRAGFAIGDSWIAFTPDSSNVRAFAVGIINTLRVAVIGVVLATLLGFLIGIMRLSSNWLVAKVGTIYVETIRNVPLLLWLLVHVQGGALGSAGSPQRDRIAFRIGLVEPRADVAPGERGERRSSAADRHPRRDRARGRHRPLGNAPAHGDRPELSDPWRESRHPDRPAARRLYRRGHGPDGRIPRPAGVQFPGRPAGPAGIPGAAVRADASTPPPSSPRSCAPASWP